MNSPRLGPCGLSRRHCLQAVLAGGLVPWDWMLPARAADPIRRTGRSYFKLSLAAYSFRDSLTGKAPRMTLDDFVQLCADLDLDGCELTSYYFPTDVKDDYLLHIKELCFRLGLDVSGTAIRNDFCLLPGPEREATLAHTKHWIDNAVTLGAPVIRIFAGTVPPGTDEAAARELCVAGINSSVEYAATQGVFLALENHGGITATPDQMLAILREVKPSPWFGVNLDGGNFRTDDPYADLAKIAPYAVNAQVKTEVTVGGRKQEADLERVVDILVRAGYRGYVVLEYEAAEDPRTAVPKYVESLRKILDKANRRG